MKLVTLTSALVLALTACGGKSKPDTSTGTSTTAPAAAAVELGEMTLFDGDEAALKIHADGTTEMGYRSGSTSELKPGETWSSDSLPMQLKAGPTIQADGTIAVKNEPKVRINADGTITDLRDNSVLPLAITADKMTLTHEGKQVGFDLAADGKLTTFGSDNPPKKPLRIEGADTPGKRRTILSFIALNFLPGKKVEGSSSAGSATAPSVP